MGIFGGNPVHKPTSSPEHIKPVETPKPNHEHGRDLGAANDRFANAQPGHHFGIERGAANEHSFRAAGAMTKFEFEHRFKSELRSSTSLTHDKINIAHAVGRGFLDADRSGLLAKREVMDSPEAKKYLEALHEAGFSKHEVDQVREAVEKNFNDV